MELLTQALAILHDLPGHLAQWTALMGPWIYVLLFAILFAETGLIITPFLPGDSLLFAVGALTAIEGALSYTWLLPLLILAANLGDLVNYSVGWWLGPRLFRHPDARFLNPKHLKKTQEFYQRHGGKTIILARFLPIIRTYAPFVAGLGRMRFTQFGVYSVVGAVVWVASFLSAGHFFGNLPSIKENFHYVILLIIVISVAPAVIHFVRDRRASAAGRGV